jgi:hypothetical protein
MADCVTTEPCWCTRLPAHPPVFSPGDDPASALCFCPACLRAKIDAARLQKE